MAASSPVADATQPYGAPTMPGPRMGSTQSGVPIVAEVRSLSSPSSASASATIPSSVAGPLKGSSSPLGSNNCSGAGGGGTHAPSPALMPPVAGARQLAKLKRFLTSLLQYGHDMSSDSAEKTEELVVKLVNATISVDEFSARIQEEANVPLRSFVVPFLKQSLHLLVRELHQIAGGGKLQSIGQKFVQQVQSTTRASTAAQASQVVASAGDKRAHVSVIDVDSPDGTTTESLRRKFAAAMEGKDAATIAFNKAMESLAPPPTKKPRLVVDTPQSPASASTGPMVSFSGGASTSTPTNIVSVNAGGSGSSSVVVGGGGSAGAPGSKGNGLSLGTNTAAALLNGNGMGSLLTGSKLTEPPDLGNKHADDWHQVDTMMQCIMGMVDKTKRALAVLQHQAQLDRDDVVNWAKTQVGNAEMDVKRRAGEVMAKAMKQAEESVQEVKRRAEEAVADVKRTAVLELQKAIAGSEARHKEAMAHLQSEMEQSVLEARRQAAEEAYDLASQQEDSTENCWNCGRKASETCSGCNVARYCGSFCQHKDWDNHHHVCGQYTRPPPPQQPADESVPTTNREEEDDEDEPPPENGGGGGTRAQNGSNDNRDTAASGDGDVPMETGKEVDRQDDDEAAGRDESTGGNNVSSSVEGARSGPDA